MRIISWNVAGFRACLKKGFEEFFHEVNADIVCLQEVKAEKEQYHFHPEGYYEYLNTADKKGYSGVLVFSKKKPITVEYGIGIDEHDHEGRVLTLEFKDFYLVNQYVPNVKRDLSRLEYRMRWEEDIKDYIKKLELKKPVVICGDFNVAHKEIDIKNAKANIGNAGFTYEEREKFGNLLDSGMIDIFRYLNPNKKDSYTWWSYIGNCRQRNIGWRIDYFLVSEKIIDKIIDTIIYNETLGSDHCPIGIEIKF